MNKSKYLLKNVEILTISNFSSKLLIFLLVPLYTSVLSTSEYGVYDLAVSTVTLLFPVLTLNVVDAVMRFTMEKETDKKKIVSIGLKYTLVGCILFGVIMLFLNLTKLSSDIQGIEILIFLYYIFYTFNQFLIQLAKGLEMVKEMGIAGIISTVITVLVNILFLLVFRWGMIGFFGANILAQAVSGSYLCFRVQLWKYVDCRLIDRSLQNEMLMYSIPIIATVVGWWVNSTADKYVVTFMIGISANGLLSVAYKIPQVINTLQGIFTQAWQISAIKEFGRKDTAKFYGNIFENINLLMCVACSILIILTRPLAHILYAKNFYEAWRFVPFLLVSSVVNCASGLLGPILSAKKDSVSLMWSAIIGSGTNVILNIVLVYLIGIQGATITTMFSSYLIYFVRKQAVVNDIEIKKKYRVILNWILLCLQCVIEIYTETYWLEFAIMASLILINHELVNKIIHKTVTVILRTKNNLQRRKYR